MRRENLEKLIANKINHVDRLEKMIEKNMKIIYLTGSFLESLTPESAVEMIDALKAALPADICYVDYAGVVVNFIFSNEAGSFRDRYGLIIASAEWPKIPEGECIPPARAVFSREGNRPGGKLICKIEDDVYNPCAEAIQHLQLKDYDLIIAKTPEAWNGMIDYITNIHMESADNRRPIVEFTYIPGGVEVDHNSPRVALRTLVDALLDPASSSESLINLASQIKKEILSD